VPVEGVAADLVESESSELDGLDPAGQCLGRLSQKLRTGTVEDEEACAKRAAVRKDAQNREKVRTALDLVDDDRSPERCKGRHRLGEPRQAPRILEVKVLGRARRNDLPSKRGLPGLARADESGDTAPPERGAKLGQSTDALDHTGKLPRKSNSKRSIFMVQRCAIRIPMGFTFQSSP
jgi:hypothetical protein